MKTVLIIIYIVFALVAFYQTSLKKDNNKYIFFLFACLLFFIAAFRGHNIDKDYSNYLNMYKISASLSFKDVEISFLLIVDFVKATFRNPIFIFVIYAVIGISLKFSAIKQLSNFWIFSALIYMSNFFLLQEVTQIRVGVAVGFMLLSIKPIYDRNFKLFLLYVILASFFHYSAIISIFLWFIQPGKFNVKVYASLIPIAYILYFCDISLLSIIKSLPIEIVQEKIQRSELFMRGSTANVFNVQQILRCFFIYLFLWKYEILIDENKYFNILLKCYIFSAISLVILHDIPLFSFRISEFFGIVEIILIPLIYCILRQKQVAASLVSLIGLCILWLNLFYIKLI